MESLNKSIEMLNRDITIEHEMPLYEILSGFHVEKVFFSMLGIISSMYPNRHYEVLIRYICTGDMQKTADEFSLDKERTLQLVNKASRSLQRDIRALGAELVRLRFINVDAKLPPEAPIDLLDLSIRSLMILKNSGARTLADVLSMSRGDILKLRNASRRSVDEIETFLTENGLSLREEGISEVHNKT